MKYPSIFERLRALSEPAHDGCNACWLFNGALTKDGYGRMNFRYHGQHVQLGAHQVAFAAYEAAAKGIEDWWLIDSVELVKIICSKSGWDIDHLCDTRHCIFPDHLHYRPKAENLSRRKHHRKGG